MSGATDPTASAEEWVKADDIDRAYGRAILLREERACSKSGEEDSMAAARLAARVLADAPALLARLREAEAALREVHGLLIDAMSQHNKGIDDDWDLVERARSEAGAFLAKPGPERKEGRT